MQAIDSLVCARWVLPIRPRDTILEHHAVAIDQGRIIDILPTDEALTQYSAKNKTDLDDHVLMPGLVNAHTHSPMTLYRGLADDLELMDWLNNHIWPAEAEFTNAQSIEDGKRLAIAEMIRGGTTCFNEMYFFPNVAAKVTRDEGMRGMIGHTIMNVPTGWAEDEDEYIAKAKEAHKKRVEDELIRYSIAPQGPYTNSDRSLSMAKELADEFDLRMNIHLHETQAELKIDLDNHGTHPMERLHKLGLLNEKLMAIHMVHLTKEEIALAAETGLHAVHCPESNLKLASGFSPVQAMLNAGVNVALGTDGAASNNDLDMFSELRTAAFIAKATNQDPTAMPAMAALELATINGAKAMGWDDEIGSLEVGKAADMIAIDLGLFLTQPVYNPISHLAYAVNRLQVCDVWINGKRLLQDGMFTQLDIEKTVTNANKWAKQAAKFSSTASKHVAV